jgi:hypothetical protein
MLSDCRDRGNRTTETSSPFEYGSCVLEIAKTKATDSIEMVATIPELG